MGEALVHAVRAAVVRQARFLPQRLLPRSQGAYASTGAVELQEATRVGPCGRRGALLPRLILAGTKETGRRDGGGLRA